MSVSPDKFLSDWNVQEFYLLVNYHAWQAHAENQYSELMRAKHAAK